MVYKGYTIYNDSQVTEEYVRELIEENGKGVFYVTYNTTTRAEVIEAVTYGKIVVLKETNPAGAVYYATLFFKGVTSTFQFVHIQDEKKFTIYALDNQGVWSKIEKSVGLPDTTVEDAEKVLTVGSDGTAGFSYIPSVKFGVGSPLTIKKDTAEETVIDFDGKGNYLDYLYVQSNGEIGYKKMEGVLLGVSSPLKFSEDSSSSSIVWDTASKHHFVLQARDTSGNVEFVENVLVCNITYDDERAKWICDKNWALIFEWLTYSMPVKMRVELQTNDFIWLDVLNEYQETVGDDTFRHIVFQHIDFCIGSNKIYVCAVDWKSDNTFSLTETRYNPPTIYNP